MKLYGRDAHGAFAPFMKVPAYTLLPLDERLSFEAGAAIGCGTGTAWGALERMGLRGRQTIVIFGQGPVGLSATMLAAAQGARVIALDVQPGRLEAALAFGAWQALDAREPDMIARLRDLTEGAGAPMVLETSGNQQAADAAIEIAAPWATVCFVGVGARVDFDVYARLRKQLTVLTSWTMSSMGQSDCARFVVERDLDLDALFTDRWQLASAQLAFERFDRQLGGKPVFLFD
jgi:threonine dehydrogenase-like Zn-dependent dehydrogenase